MTRELQRRRLRILRPAVLRETAEADRRAGLALALVRLELALPIFEELGDLVSVGVVLNNMGIPVHYEGKWDEALTRYRAGREASRRAGDVLRAATATGNEAEILLDQGRLDEAEERFNDALRVQRAAGFAFGVGAATLNLGMIAARRGQLDEARRLLADTQLGTADDGAAAQRIFDGLGVVSLPAIPLP